MRWPDVNGRVHDSNWGPASNWSRQASGNRGQIKRSPGRFPEHASVRRSIGIYTSWSQHVSPSFGRVKDTNAGAASRGLLGASVTPCRGDSPDTPCEYLPIGLLCCGVLNLFPVNPGEEVSTRECTFGGLRTSGSPRGGSATPLTCVVYVLRNQFLRGSRVTSRNRPTSVQGQGHHTG